MNIATSLIRRYMKQHFRIQIDESQLVWEAVTLFKEEMDEQMVPVVELTGFSDPLTICCSNYEDTQGNDWLFGLAIEEMSGKWLHGWIVRNGEIVVRDVPFGDAETPS